MYRALFLSHGEFSVELLKAVELILGEQTVEEVRALPLPPGQDMAVYLAEIEAFVQESKNRGGAILFTDLAGGSPFLTAAQTYQRYSGEMPLEVITGVNLPMAIEALSARETATVAEGREVALGEGRRGVFALSTELAV